MRCSEASASLPEYMRRRLPNAAAAELRQHLGDCGGCRAAVDAELAIAVALRNDAIAPPPRLLAGVMDGVGADPRRAAGLGLRTVYVFGEVCLTVSLGGVSVVILCVEV